MCRQTNHRKTKTSIFISHIDSDINKDEQIDYFTKDASGSFGCWRNGGYADVPIERMQVTGKGIAQDGASMFEGKGMPDTASVPLANFNCKSELAPTTMSIGVS